MVVTALPTIETAVSDVAKRYKEYTKDIRRKLHEFPELAWEEKKTLDFIKLELAKIVSQSELDIVIKERIGGLVVDVTICQTYPLILFRADIDGLPIQEETDLPFSSKSPGKMHACGHDFHTAMLLGALKAIAIGEITPVHNLRLVFQRAEEIGSDFSGGSVLNKEGVCVGVQEVFCLHINSMLQCGVFSSNVGPMLANTSLLEIEVSCSGGHVMRPYCGSNAIDIMNELTNGLKGIETKCLPPGSLVLLVPSFCQAGVAVNVRPSTVKLSYALRHFLEQDFLDQMTSFITQKVHTIVSGFPTARIRKCSITHGYPIVSNDEESFHKVRSELLREGFPIKQCPRMFCGDDFAYYLQQCPGSYWFLGAKTGDGQDHHTSEFNPDESTLWKGVAFWLALASSHHQSRD